MFGDIALVTIAIIAMVGVLFVSVIPFVPGPLLMWMVALGYGLLNDFERLHVIVLGIMTLLMILGSTTDYWTPIIGMRAQGGSCWGAMGTIIGALVGTFFIPIPIPLCGTLVGAVIGALAFEFVHIGDARQAMRAGQIAFKYYIAGLIIEFMMSVSIFLLFLGNIWLTR